MTEAGVSLCSFHCHGRDVEAVVSALRFGRFTPAWVAPPTGPWVSFFPRLAETHDFEVLDQIGRNLSKTLSAYIWSVCLQQSTVLLYTLFHEGDIAAEYDSFPDAESDWSWKYWRATGGAPELLAGLRPAGADVSELEYVLRRKPREEAIMEIIAEEKLEDKHELLESLPEDYVRNRIMEKRGYRKEEERLAELCEIMGAPNAMLSYSVLELYFSESREGLIDGEEEFVRVVR